MIDQQTKTMHGGRGGGGGKGFLDAETHDITFPILYYINFDLLYYLEGIPRPRKRLTELMCKTAL